MLIEKLIKWAFGNRIKIFKAQYYHTDRMTQLGYGLPETKEQIKKRLLNDLIYELEDMEEKLFACPKCGNTMNCCGVSDTTQDWECKQCGHQEINDKQQQSN